MLHKVKKIASEKMQNMLTVGEVIYLGKELYLKIMPAAL